MPFVLRPSENQGTSTLKIIHKALETSRVCAKALLNPVFKYCSKLLASFYVLNSAFQF